MPKNASVFFTIFQTFMTGTGEFTFQGYPPDFFDLIVIDECHRGGANDESTWRGILEYFRPAVQLGLTATPKRGANADTYAYFGDPVYTYALKEGIGDGFLTPFKVRQMASTLDTYRFSDEDEVVSGEIDPDREYTEADFNTRLVIDERELSRVHEFMDQIDQRQKTLVFCATQDHAARVRNFINQVKDNPDPHYCERVTADDGKLGEQHLREFQDNEKTLPTILTTSHKLSTGVDARNVRNIVLLRPIKSMIEFKQIIGRGTRTFDGKDFFTIYDFVRAHEHFNDPEWDGEPLPPEEPIRAGQARMHGSRTPARRAGRRPRPSIPRTPAERIVVRLADGKERNIRYIASTTYWSHDGKPITAQEFMDQLFGDIGTLVASEDELRTDLERPRSAHGLHPAARRARLRRRPDRGHAPAHRRPEQRHLRRPRLRPLHPRAADPVAARRSRPLDRPLGLRAGDARVPRLRAPRLRGARHRRARPDQDRRLPPDQVRRHQRREAAPRSGPCHTGRVRRHPGASVPLIGHSARWQRPKRLRAIRRADGDQSASGGTSTASTSSSTGWPRRVTVTDWPATAPRSARATGAG